MLIALMGLLITSCANKNDAPKEVHDHKEHTADVANTTNDEQVNKYENELGQALDANGHLITGCPIHKEMIGVEGDECPKCDYMKMLPITWSLQGIDTVRVKTLPDYHPSTAKL